MKIFFAHLLPPFFGQIMTVRYRSRRSDADGPGGHGHAIHQPTNLMRQYLIIWASMTGESEPNDASPSTADSLRGKPGVSDARLIRSEELVAGGKMVRIQHGDEQYRLLITRNNRLILQK